MQSEWAAYEAQKKIVGTWVGGIFQLPPAPPHNVELKRWYRKINGWIPSDEELAIWMHKLLRKRGDLKQRYYHFWWVKGEWVKWFERDHRVQFWLGWESMKQRG